MSHNSAPASKSSSPEQSSGLKSVDELIDYINGGKKNIDQSAKEQRKSSGIKKKSGKNKKVILIFPNDFTRTIQTTILLPCRLRILSPKAPLKWHQVVQSMTTNPTVCCNIGRPAIHRLPFLPSLCLRQKMKRSLKVGKLTLSFCL